MTNIYTFKFIYINNHICIHVTDKIFSFLSQDEVEKMRQEEGKDIIIFSIIIFHSFILYTVS